MSLKIISYKSIGEKQTYNLTMKGKNHNYILSSNVVSANSHSISYSVISYQTAWLKTYYLKEFCCSLLDSSIKDQDDLVKYIYMAKDNNIPIMPPDVNLSQEKFVLDNGTIVFGLAGVKGMGEKASSDFLSRRPEEGFKSVEHMVSLGVKKNHIKALAKCGALEEISELSRECLVQNLDDMVEYYKKHDKYLIRVKKIEDSIKAIEVWEANPDGPRPRKAPKINEKHIPVMPELVESPEFKGDRLSFERQTLGFYLTGHPMDRFPGLSNRAKYTIDDVKSLTENNTKIEVPVVISSVNKIRTRKDKNMASVMIEDKSGRIEATIFPNQWKKLKDVVKEDTVNMIKGTVRVTQMDDDRPPIVNVIINDVNPIENDNFVAKPIKVMLTDGTQVEFIPSVKQNFSVWQQAIAIANNVRKMG